MAITVSPPPYGINPGRIGDDLLTRIIRNGVTIIFTISAVLVVFYLLWGVIDLIMSAGEKEKLNNARRKITFALVGLLVLAISFLIMNVIGKLFNYSPLQEFNIPSFGD